jgi:hypothetical protein
MSDSADPIKSQYQATPWQPNVDPSSKDSGDEKKAASTYDDTYGGSYTTNGDSSSTSSATGSYDDPTLAMSYTTAPDLVPVTSSSSGSGSAPAAAPMFSVQLGVLRSSEQSCLDAVNASVQDYQSLKSTVSGAASSNSVFGQIVGKASDVNPDSKAGWLEGTGPTMDQLDSEGKNFAAAVVPQMEQLLQACGNIITAMGQFTALLNNAGQMYTDTDAQSAFTVPGSAGS